MSDFDILLAIAISVLAFVIAVGALLYVAG